jgi:hypothetical protein
MIFNLIYDGEKYYLCMKDDLSDITIKKKKLGHYSFFTIKNKLFSKQLTTDDKHSIIEKELAELVWTLRANEDYSYDELIRPLLREAKLKNIGL